MKLTLPYPPTVNMYWRHCRGRTFISHEGRSYKAIVAALGMAARARPFAGPVVLTVDVYRPKRQGDLDNTLKALLDGLKGVAFEDDSQIVDIHARRFDDKANPRAVVTVEAAGEG